MKNETIAFIASQPADRQSVMTAIHAIIMEADKSVTPVIEPMMGKEMIVYKDRGMMKYALSSVKNHISLHVLPMYMNVALMAKYQPLLPDAVFQKGCINFTKPEQVLLPVLKKILADCAPIDLVKIREDYLASKKKTAKNK